MEKKFDLDKALDTFNKGSVLKDTKKVLDEASTKLGQETVVVLSGVFEIIETLSEIVPDLHKPLTDALYSSCGYETHVDCNGEFYDGVFKYKEGHVYQHIFDTISRYEDNPNLVRMTRNNSIYITPRIKKLLKSYSKTPNYDLNKAKIVTNGTIDSYVYFLNSNFLNLPYLVSCEKMENLRVITFAEIMGEQGSAISLVQYKILDIEGILKFEKQDIVTIEHTNVDNIINRLI